MIILAGITIGKLTSDNGVVKEARTAQEQTERKGVEEQIELAVIKAEQKYRNPTMDNVIEELKNNKVISDASQVDRETGTVTSDLGYVIEGKLDAYVEKIIMVGDTVTYEPKGETYTWKAEYCSSKKTITTDDVDIKSGKDQDYNITSWKVLNINNNGTLDLIAAAPTSGTVYLGDAQGYNNAVYLLNEACSTLYGDSSKGITARSVKIEDIEGKMLDTALTNEEGTGAHDYANVATYGEQISSAYTSSKNYPSIYAQETLSVINGITNNNGIGMSEQDTLVGRTDNGASSGAISTATSIQPYQTYWYKDNEFLQTAFKSEGDVNYYSLFMPIGFDTYYWIASRYVSPDRAYCFFGVNCVREGCVAPIDTFYSNGTGSDLGSHAICPVLTLKSTLLTGSHASGWTVE